MMATEKALREALQKVMDYPEIRSYMGSILANYADAALSLPETQGEPVGENLEPLPPEVHEAINAYAAYYAEHHKLGMSIRNDMQYIASVALRFAPPSQPAQGWRLVPVEPTPKMSAAGLCVSEAEHDPAGVYRAMLAAAPAAPTQACRSDGRCQYAIDHGAEGLASCPVGKCAMQAKPTNGEGA